MAWRSPSRFFPARYTGPTERDPTRRYHYTNGVWLPAILRDGKLDPQRSEGPRSLGGKIVWASAHPVWEPSVTIGLPDRDLHGFHPIGSFQQTVAVARGVVRFVMAAETVPYDFPTLCVLARIPKPLAKMFTRASSKIGASVSDWYGTFAPVVEAQWLAVEVWSTDHWRPLTAEERAAARDTPPPEITAVTERAHEVMVARGWTVGQLVSGYWSGDWGALPGEITTSIDGDKRLAFVDLEGDAMLCLWIQDGRLTISHSDDFD